MLSTKELKHKITFSADIMVYLATGDAVFQKVDSEILKISEPEWQARVDSIQRVIEEKNTPKTLIVIPAPTIVPHLLKLYPNAQVVNAVTQGPVDPNRRITICLYRNVNRLDSIEYELLILDQALFMMQLYFKNLCQGPSYLIDHLMKVQCPDSVFLSEGEDITNMGEGCTCGQH